MRSQILKLLYIGLFTIFCMVSAYIYFQPKEADVVEDNYIAAEHNLTYANAKDHVLQDNKIHYFWLCDVNNPDCTYVRDYVIKPLAEESKNTDFEILEYVDFNEAPESEHYRVQNWGIKKYPAFLAVQNVDGKMTILSSLSWDKDFPFDSDDLKKWMYDNDIWHGIYEESNKIDGAIE